MDRERAREIAETFLRGVAGMNPLRTGQAVETKRSWLFATEAISGEILLGNAPIVVDKASGARFDRIVWREFVDEASLSGLQRMKRWVARRWRY